MGGDTHNHKGTRVASLWDTNTDQWIQAWMDGCKNIAKKPADTNTHTHAHTHTHTCTHTHTHTHVHARSHTHILVHV